MAALWVAAATLPFLRGGVDSSGTLAMGLAGGLALVAVGAGVAWRGRIETPRLPGHAWWIAFALLLGASWLWSIDRGTTLEAIARNLPVLAAYGAILLMPRRSRFVHGTTDFLIGVGAVVALAYLASPYVSILAERLPVNPNHIGIPLAALGAVGITGAVLQQRSRPQRAAVRWLRAAAGLLAVAAALATGSRGAMLALAAGLAAPALRARRPTPAALLAGGVALGLVVGVVLSLESARHSVWIRLDIWRFSLERLLERPLFGFGLGTFEQVGRSLPLVHWTLGTSHAHSTPIELLVENGLVAGLLAALGIGSVVPFIARHTRRRFPSEALPLVAGGLALGVPALFEFHLFLPMAALWLAMMCAASLLSVALADPSRMIHIPLGRGTRTTAAVVLVVAGVFFLQLGIRDEWTSWRLRAAGSAAASEDFVRAERILEGARSVALRPARVDEALGKLLLTSRRLGEPVEVERIVRVFERSVAASPWQASAWQGLAEARRLAGDARGRVAAFERAAELDGLSEIERWSDLASARMSIGDERGAVEACRISSRALGRLDGRCLSALRLAGGSREALRGVVSANPDDWLRLARFLRDGAAPIDEIRHTLRKALELDPAHAASAWMLYRLEQRMSAEPDAGVDVLERAHAAGVMDARLLVALSEGLLVRNRMDEARAIAREVLSQKPRLPAAHRVVARSIARQHGIEAEAEYWESQADSRPGWRLPLEEAERAWRAAGDAGRAQSAGQRALELPDVAAPPPPREGR